MKYCFVLLLSIVNPAFAQIWDYIITSNSGTVYYINPSSILKQGEIVSYVQLLNYPNGYDQKNPEIHSITHTKEIDCKSNESRTISMIAYDREDAKGGIQTLFLGREAKWEKINENSILSLFKKEVCR